MHVLHPAHLLWCLEALADPVAALTLSDVHVLWMQNTTEKRMSGVNNTVGIKKGRKERAHQCLECALQGGKDVGDQVVVCMNCWGPEGREENTEGRKVEVQGSAKNGRKLHCRVGKVWHVKAKTALNRREAQGVSRHLGGMAIQKLGTGNMHQTVTQVARADCGVKAACMLVCTLDRFCTHRPCSGTEVLCTLLVALI